MAYLCGRLGRYATGCVLKKAEAQLGNVEIAEYNRTSGWNGKVGHPFFSATYLDKLAPPLSVEHLLPTPY